MKNEREGKIEQGSVYSIYLYIYIPLDYMIIWFSENKLPRAIYKENYKTKYLRLFTPFPNLITKESYNWWVTRRKWGFRHKKSEAKDPKVLITNIGKLQEKFHSTVQNGCEIISQQKGDFAAVQNSSFSLEWSASNGCNSFISTPNLTLFEALDCWLPELRNDI